MQIKNYQSILKKSCRKKIMLYFLFSTVRGLTLPVTMFLTQKIIDSITTSTILACQICVVAWPDIFGGSAVVLQWKLSGTFD